MISRTILASLAILTAAPAVAQGGQCDWLQSQYLAATRQGGDGAEAARQLGQARAAADRMNCMGGFFAIFGPPPSPGCGAVMANINRLQASLAPRSFGGFFQPNLGSLRDELRYNGCEMPDASYGRARTICVRACDGYYFPISASSQRSRWKVDAEACQSMYGATGQAELYTYDPNGDVAEAKSLTGKRYGDQPFAFLYRNSHDQACASQLTAGIAALGARYLAVKTPDAKPVVAMARAVPMPQPRSSISEDPETIANRAGGLVPGPITVAETRTVRQVGPAYYAEMYSPPTPVAATSLWTWPFAAHAAELPQISVSQADAPAR